MSNSIDTITLEVTIQENGIIRRKSDGYLIGELTDDDVANFDAMKEYIKDITKEDNSKSKTATIHVVFTVRGKQSHQIFYEEKDAKEFYEYIKESTDFTECAIKAVNE